MNNNFIKQKNNTQNKPKTSSNNRNRVLAYVLLVLMVFWTVGSVLGVISYFRNDKDDYVQVYADEVVSVFRDEIDFSPVSNHVVYRDYDFSGSPNENFASPFRIELTSSTAITFWLCLRFKGNVTQSDKFGYFYGGEYHSRQFYRSYADGYTYYHSYSDVTFMSNIISNYGGSFDFMALNYNFDTVFDYDFELFIVQADTTSNIVAFIQGYMSNGLYHNGFTDGLRAVSTGVFYGGYGSLNYVYGGTNYTMSFNPLYNEDFFNNGQFLLSHYIVETLGSRLSSITGLSLSFTLAATLDVSPSNYLISSISGNFSSGQSLGITISYYNYSADTGQRVYAGSSPVANFSNGVLISNDNFFTINNDPTLIDGVPVNNFLPVEVDRFIISFNLDTFKTALSSENNSISLGFPSGFYQGYLSGVIEGQLSVDTDFYYKQGIEVGKTSASGSYQLGFDAGVASANQYSFLGLFGAVIDAPIQAISGLLNFDLLGFNMLNLFTGLITLALIVFVIRLIW